VPLAGKDKWPVVKSFAASLAEEMVEATPQAYVATISKAKRTGKIFIDYFRNDYTATAIADYAVRARPGAPVAVPLDWRSTGRAAQKTARARVGLSFLRLSCNDELLVNSPGRRGKY
jgi:DNA primase